MSSSRGRPTDCHVENGRAVYATKIIVIKSVYDEESDASKARLPSSSVIKITYIKCRQLGVHFTGKYSV